MRFRLNAPWRLTLVAIALCSALSACGGGSSSPGQPAATGRAGGSAGGQSAAGRSPAARAHHSATAIPKAVARDAAKQASKLSPTLVATVGGEPITKAQFAAAYAAQIAAMPGGRPDPPTYTRCVAMLKSQFAALRKRAARLLAGSPLAAGHTKGAPKIQIPSDPALRKQCAQRGQAARQGAMTQLTQEAWTQQEAKATHVTVSGMEVSAALARQRKAFPSAAAYAQFLKRSGASQAQLRERMRLQLLNQRLAARRMGPPVKVTDADVARYFEQHRAQFGVPERRDIEVILAKTQATAQLAKRAVQNGMAWRAAAAKWSIDPITKASGGELLGVVKGSQDAALNAVAFRARPGATAGPVKGARGWYVVRVTKVEAATKPQLGAYPARIRVLLAQQVRAQRTARAMQGYERRRRAATVCRPGYVVPLCANAPAEQPRQGSR
jgi:parvulin-like peptidyl-prolyl isomerase